MESAVGDTLSVQDELVGFYNMRILKDRTENSGSLLKNVITCDHKGLSQFSFPDRETLTAVLTPIFEGNSSPARQLIGLRRKPNIYSSTFASEVVGYRLADGSEARLFCKYGAGYLDDGSTQRGVPYEVEVYRQVLERLPFSTPQFLGSYQNETTGRAWLVLEYLESYLPVNKTTEPDALRLAARWIGRFHAAGEKQLSRASISNLNTYNTEYFAAWRRRMSEIPNHLRLSFSWLPDLCERSNGFVASLLAAQPTVIHGELFPSNALIRNGNVYVVDWESAGIGAGELDLAALTMGPWPEEVIKECEEEYRLARWLEGSPSDFDQTLTAARLYFSFKLLFCLLRFRPDRAAQDVWLFENLRAAGERFGLI